jgi:hypothetical protein
VYVVDSTRKRTASFGKNWPGKFMHSPQVKNSSMQAMDSRRCLNSASSQRQAGENHAAKVENCNARLAIQRFKRTASLNTASLRCFRLRHAQSKFDTVQAMYCEHYRRQSNVAASWSQPAETYNIARLARRLLLYSAVTSRQTRKLKTTIRELCVDSPYFHLAFADVQLDATLASYRTR